MAVGQGPGAGSRDQKGYLYVSVAHVVLVSLQGQVSVLLTDEANESFSVPPALSVQTECNPSSGQTQQTGNCGKGRGGGEWRARWRRINTWRC